jgi:[NiFe] hydrogenase assembly HybE family chaperone
MQFHTDDPSPLIEATFRHIHQTRMTDLPMVNPVLAVAAVGFVLHEGREWRGALLTPWGIGILLVPASADWDMPPSHERAFRKYASGTFAFLGNQEDGLGEYLLCPLLHDTTHIPDQETALTTARACLIALDLSPGEVPPEPADPSQPTSLSRRRFFMRQTA